MSGNTISRFYVIIALLLFALLDMHETLAEDSPPTFMHVKLILSDSEIFTNDGLAYKVIITNITRSSITICGPTVRPPFACVIEMKEAGGEWQEVWNYSEMMELFVRGPIQIAAGSTWAEYGQVFLTKGKRHVFGKVGKYELRGRIKSAIGSYLSHPVPLDVKAWPKGQEHLDKRFVPYGHLVLDLNTIASQLHSADLDTLCKRHPSGGVGRTLKMMLAVHCYVESGEIEGKVATWSEAFKSLSVGLDEVRRDQLVHLFAFGAMKKKQWKDVAFLVEQLDHESNLLRSRRSELETAIRRGAILEP